MDKRNIEEFQHRERNGRQSVRELVVDVCRAGNSFNCGWAYPGIGSIIVSEKTQEKVKQAFMEALSFHIEGMKKDGDNVPEWLAKGYYRIVFRECGEKTVKVVIEKSGDGRYSAYMPDDEMDYSVIGTGETIDETIADFYAGYEEMKAYYKSNGDNFEEAAFSFCYESEK